MLTVRFSKRALLPVYYFIIVFVLLQILLYRSPNPSLLTVALLDVIYIFCFVFAYRSQGRFLRVQWREFRSRRKIKYVVVGVGFLLSHLIIYLVKYLLPSSDLQAEEVIPYTNPALSSLKLLMGAAVLPLLAPFFEELVFRYSLFKNLATSNFKMILAALLSSLLFGLIHYNNFNGSVIRTIPYMVVGLFYCWVYYRYKNIFYTILMHLLVNWINLLLGVIGFIILGMCSDC